MLQRFRNRKGQTTLEYAILVIIVMAALISIQMYVKRGIQGRMRQASDDIGTQFSPGNTNYVRTTVSKSQTKDTFIDGVTKSQILRNKFALGEITNTDMTENIMNQNREFWGKDK